MNKPEILFCTNGIYPLKVGGMQKHSQLLIETLAKRNNVKLTVIHPHHQQEIFSHLPGVVEISVPPVKKEIQYIITQYLYSKEIYKIAQQHPNAIIYSQGISVWYNLDKLKFRLIVNPHGLESYQGLSFKDQIISFPFRLIFNSLFEKAAKVVSLGGRLTDILKRKVRNPDENLVILPNAAYPVIEYDWVNSHRHKHKETSILFVGRFASNKGIDHLFEAISLLSKTPHFQQFKFCLAGKGPLFKQFSSGNAFENVEFPGFVTDEILEELFRNADVLILPTLFEGMPTVILEAMARKLPIITTDVGATKELVDETNGFIIPKKNPEAILEALLNFANLSQEKRRELGRNSQKKFLNNFTWEKVASEHEKVFSSLARELDFLR